MEPHSRGRSEWEAKIDRRSNILKLVAPEKYINIRLVRSIETHFLITIDKAHPNSSNSHPQFKKPPSILINLHHASPNRPPLYSLPPGQHGYRPSCTSKRNHCSYGRSHGCAVHPEECQRDPHVLQVPRRLRASLHLCRSTPPQALRQQQSPVRLLEQSRQCGYLQFGHCSHRRQLKEHHPERHPLHLCKSRQCGSMLRQLEYACHFPGR
jgi:hypothetical protein